MLVSELYSLALSRETMNYWIMGSIRGGYVGTKMEVSIKQGTEYGLQYILAPF